MAWQMSGGPARATAAKHSSAAISAMANRGERISWDVMDFLVSFRIVSTLRKQDALKGRAVNNVPALVPNSLGPGWALRPVVLVHAPEADVAVAEGVPPRVEHLAVEAEDALVSYTCGRRSERGEAVIDAGAIFIADAGQQMPKRQGVVLARIHKDDPKQLATFRRRVRAKI